MTSPDNHRLDRQNLNKQTNEDTKQDTPEHNEIIRHEGKLGQGTHEGRKQTKSPLKLRQTEHNRDRYSMIIFILVNKVPHFSYH